MADLARLSRELRYFAAVIGVLLTDWQASALLLDKRITTIAAGRQMGKSRSLAVLALWWAYRRGEQRVLIVSAGEDAARRLLGEIRRMIAASPLLAGSVVDEQAGLVTLTNGSEIRCVPASERQVRGWTVDLLLVDEAALVADDLVLGAAFPTTAARPDARIVLASSASVASGAFFDLFRRGEYGDEHVHAVRWVARAAGGDCDAPWITASFIEALRAALSPARFAAEILALFASGADLFWPGIRNRLLDYALTPFGALAGPARLLAGVDWGARSDRSAFAAVGRLPVPSDEPVFGVACAHRWDAGYPLPDVVEEIATTAAHLDTLVAEQNGIGEGCTQLLWRRWQARRPEAGAGTRPRAVLVEEGYGASESMMVRRRPGRGFVTRRAGHHTSAASKAATLSALRLLEGRGQLAIPASATDLVRELALLKIELTQTGERIEASVGHDDLADALWLAAGPYRDRSGAWRCVLADLADPRRRTTDAVVPRGALALASVESPYGWRVPAHPVWQSVRGTELTVSDEVAAWRPPPDRRLEAARARMQEINQRRKEQHG